MPFRKAARALGLGFEVHAGEMGPPSSIADTLDVLEADRIGHGVAAIRDPALMDRLVRDGVVLDTARMTPAEVYLGASRAAHQLVLV